VLGDKDVKPDPPAAPTTILQRARLSTVAAADLFDLCSGPLSSRLRVTQTRECKAFIGKFGRTDCRTRTGDEIVGRIGHGLKITKSSQRDRLAVTGNAPGRGQGVLRMGQDGLMW
jgi:hypothetical protein